MSAIVDAGIAFAQLRANKKIVRDEDSRRWVEDVETALNDAENVEMALTDALEYVLKSGGFEGEPEPIRAALRLAGRLP